MPRPAPYTLTWCEDSQGYELQSGGKPEQWFRQADEQDFVRWLAEHTAFSFAGRAGRLSVRKEGRGSGKDYWYAYRKQDQRMRKGYLGPSAQVTFAQLEELARCFERYNRLCPIEVLAQQLPHLGHEGRPGFGAG